MQAGKNITSSNIYEEIFPEHRYLCYGGNGVRGYVSNYNREGRFALIGRQGALCGNINIATGQFYATEHAVVVDHYSLTDVVWSSWFLRAINLNQYATATAQPGLAVANIVKVLIPPPPLTEQKRIVAKIEEFLPYIDRYEQAWSYLEDFNRRFPDDMKKSILQSAIQGKLVEQRSEEGTAEELYQQIQEKKQRLIKAGKIKKERPLPEISEDDKPFDIPESWKWVRVCDLTFLKSGNQYPENEYGHLYVKVADMNLPENQFEIVTSSQRADIPECDLIPRNSIIFPKRGGAIATNKKRLVLLEEIGVDSNTMSMTMIDEKVLPYVSKWFSSVDLGKLSTGTSVPQINNKDINPLLILLPPLAEQKRIVAKLEELLPLCEWLK